MCKVINTVRSLALLRRAVRRWRSRAAASVLPNNDVLVPAGHVAVCVRGRGDGESSSRRFVVPVAQLSHPAFWELLQQAEEEYGFPSASGPLALPCDEDRFRAVLRRVSAEERRGVPAVSSSDVAARPLLPRVAAEELVW